MSFYITLTTKKKKRKKKNRTKQQKKNNACFGSIFIKITSCCSHTLQAKRGRVWRPSWSPLHYHAHSWLSVGSEKPRSLAQSFPLTRLNLRWASGSKLNVATHDTNARGFSITTKYSSLSNFIVRLSSPYLLNSKPTEEEGIFKAAIDI